MQKIGCIVVDFDGTIAHFRDYSEGEYVGLNSALANFGIPLSEVERIYRIVRDGGFSPKRFTDALHYAGYRFDSTAANTAIQKWLDENLAIFPDVCGAIESWIALGIPVYVVTTGEADWQRQKVNALSADISAMFVTGSDADKESLILRLQKEHGFLIAIDDKPGVLDALRDDDPDGIKFLTVRALRNESKYRRDVARHEHLRVTTFTDRGILEWSE